MPKVLKKGPRRTVTIEGNPPDRRVVKRFHSPRGVDALKDGLRAWREFYAHGWMRRRGIRTPRAIEVRKNAGAFELVTCEVHGSASLDDLLRGQRPWPCPPRVIAARLGELLAALTSSHLRHPDLHPGNVLVDPLGQVFLIDLARVRPTFRSGVHKLMLELAAGTRELASPAFRARVSQAHARVSGVDFYRRATSSFEDDARLLRRDQIHKRLARYHRPSGVMADVDSPPGLVHRDVFEQLGGKCSAMSHPAHWDTWTPAPWDDARESLFVQAPLTGALLRRWNSAARLEAHHLPSLRPVAHFSGPDGRVVLDRPRGCRSLGECWRTWNSEDRLKAAHNAGRLLGQLFDRRLGGLKHGESGILAVTPSDLFLSIPDLVDIDDTHPLPILAHWQVAVGSNEPAHAKAFAQGFASTQRGTRQEREFMSIRFNL